MASERAQRLTFGTKLAYGFGDVTGAVISATYGFFMQAFLLDVAGLAPAAAGLIFAAAQIWDAVTDPMMGRISDRTRTRWGRRRPFLLFGAVPLALAFFLHWLVPPVDGTWLVLYYLLVALLLRTTFTVISVPYAALTPDLAPDHDGRTSLNMYRFMFSLLGALVAVIAHPLIVAGAGNVYLGHIMSAGIWALVIVVSSFACFAFTREREDLMSRPERPLTYRQRLVIIFSNRPYLIATALFLLSWVALQFVQANLLLYARYWLDAEAQFTSFVALLQICAALSLIGWAAFSKRFGKRATYVTGVGLWGVMHVFMFFMMPGQDIALYTVAIFAGIGLGAAYLIPWSMLPDTIEHNELATGERQEGLFYGFFIFLQKLALSIGLGLSGVMLGLAGYVTPAVVDGQLQLAQQPDSALLTLRLFVSLVPAIVLFVSLPIALAYPITRERHDAMRQALAERE